MASPRSLIASASASIGSNSSGPMATTPARSNASLPPSRRCVEIVKRPDDSSGFIVLPRRWVVERTFSGFGRDRRLVKDYENLADALAAFITLACIQLAIRRLARA
jgi:transposase